MKKELNIMIAATIVIGLMLTVVSAAADCASNVEVGSDLQIVGTGTMYRDLLAQSEWGYNGQRLTETMYSKWKATDGLSNISYNSNLNIYLGASETHENENTSEISYAQTAFTSNMNHRLYSQNYEAGVATCFKTVGMAGKAFEVEMLPDGNYLELEGGIDGRATLKHMVVDPTTRLKIVKETTQLKGQYDINWIAFGEKLIYPGSGGDWLGCP